MNSLQFPPVYNILITWPTNPCQSAVRIYKTPFSKEAGWKSKEGLAKWMEIGKKFALSLPEKKTNAKKTKTLREYKM